MKAKYVYKNKFQERRLTYGKLYDIIDRFTIVENIDEVQKEVEYIEITDDTGDIMKYATKYGNDVWFIDIVEMRDQKINSILDI